MALRSALSARAPAAAARRHSTVRPLCRHPLPVRASAQEPEQQQAPTTDSVPSTSSRTVAPDFALLNVTNEAINGRAAMLGFVAAIVAEAVTHHSVFSQVAGKVVDAEVVETPYGASDLGFFMVVALVTLGTLAPRLLENAPVDSRSFGPFTPNLEKTLGRVAMLGFVGLLLTEAIKGSSLI